MTTGEKIAKYRKEKGYTQESFGELLGVTRQSVSKWESDISFPETDKLITISKLFNCSIDYLLGMENKTESVELCENKQNNEESFCDSNSDKLINKIFTTIWSSVFLVLTLLFYLIPYAYFSAELLEIEVGVNANIYDILGDSSYGSANVLVLLALICQIIMFILGIVLLLIKNRGIYITRLAFGILETILWLFLLFMLIDAFNAGMLLMIVISAGNLIGLLLIKYNKYEGTQEPINVSNYATTIWTVLFFVINLLLYFLPYSLEGIIVDKVYIDIGYNVYDFLGATDYEPHHVIILCALMCQIIMLALGVSLAFIKDRRIFIARYILAVVEVVLCILPFIYIEFQVGMGLLILFSLGDLVGLSIIKFNKCPKESKNKVDAFTTKWNK